MAKINTLILQNDRFNGKKETVNIINREYPGYKETTTITTTYSKSKLPLQTTNFNNNNKLWQLPNLKITKSFENPIVIKSTVTNKKIEPKTYQTSTSTVTTTKCTNLNYQSPYKTNNQLPYSSIDKSPNKTIYESPYRSTYYSPISGNISPQIINSKKNNNIIPTSPNYFFKPSLIQETNGKNSSSAIVKPNITATKSSAIVRPNITATKLSSPGAYKTSGTITPLNIANLNPPINLKTKNKKLGPGILYIFNHDEFQNPNNEYRKGSKCDVKLLKDTFKKFKVNVTIFENFTVQKIKNQVEKIYKQDLSKNSCIVIAILSHGNRLDRIAANDGSYSIHDDILFPILRNKTLEGKPKILIVQACKGDIDLREFQTDSSQVNTKLNFVPDEIYKFYSTSEGFVSYRSEQGSIFIKAFCEEFEKSGSEKSIREIMESAIKVIKLRTSGQQIPSMCVNNTEPYVFGNYF